MLLRRRKLVGDVTYIAIPPAPVVWMGNLGPNNVQNNTAMTVTETSDPANMASVSGTSIIIGKTGVYAIMAFLVTGDKVFTDNKAWRCHVYVNGVDNGTIFPSETQMLTGGGIVRCHCELVIALQAGWQVQIVGNSDGAGAWTINATGGVQLTFIPTTANPKPFP